MPFITIMATSLNAIGCRPSSLLQHGANHSVLWPDFPWSLDLWKALMWMILTKATEASWGYPANPQKTLLSLASCPFFMDSWAYSCQIDCHNVHTLCHQSRRHFPRPTGHSVNPHFRSSGMIGLIFSTLLKGHLEFDSGISALHGIMHLNCECIVLSRIPPRKLQPFRAYSWAAFQHHGWVIEFQTHSELQFDNYTPVQLIC